MGKVLAEQRQGPEFESPKPIESWTHYDPIIPTLLQKRQENPQKLVGHLHTRDLPYTRWKMRSAIQGTDLGLHTCVPLAWALYTHTYITHKLIHIHRKKKGRKEIPQDFVRW